MLGLEALDQRGRVDLARRAGDIDGDAPVLAAIADVRRPEPLDLAEAGDALRRSDAHLVLEAGEERQVARACVDAAEADVVELRAREEKADRREEAGERRHDRGADAELRRERAAWIGPAPP